MYGGGGLYSKKREVRRKKESFIYFFLGLIISSLVLAILWFVPRLPQVLIKEISVSGNTSASSEEIKHVTVESLRGAFYIFFPKYNSLWYPKEGIEKNILNDFPRVASANVSLSNMRDLHIEIKERSSYGLLCGGEISKPENCYFLDDKGFIFAKAPEFTGSVYKRYFSTTTTPTLGRQFIPESDFKAINLFIEELQKNNIIIETVRLEEESLRLGLDSGGEIIIDKSLKNPNADLENLLTLITSKEFKGKDGAGNFKFQYIDLRFGNKLFYKI